MSVFTGYRMPDTRISEWDNGGRDLLAKRFEPFVTSGKPIEMFMLGFPFKSPNHVHKTIGVRPDYAEELAFKQFREFGEEMRAIYTPGVNLTIASDGFMFNELLEEKEYVVDAYQEESRAMAEGAPVTLMSLRDFYGTDTKTARDKAIAQFGINEEQLEKRILFDVNVHALYLGMIEFMFDELKNHTFPSIRQHTLSAKKLARDMMFMNEAYSNLAEHEFEGRIRLSMHATSNMSKWGFQLIPGTRSLHSPWHCVVAVEADGSITTMHREDAERAKYRLIEDNGRPYFFRATRTITH